jgi:hypothetical protein
MKYMLIFVIGRSYRLPSSCNGLSIPATAESTTATDIFKLHVGQSETDPEFQRHPVNNTPRRYLFGF